MRSKQPKTDESGQSLIELVISLAVAGLVLGAFAFATVTSLRNAQFAKSSAQATKLAQEGLENVRSLRNRDGAIDYTKPDLTHTSKFSDLWGISFNCPGNCYFFFSSSGVLTGGTTTSFEAIPPGFSRQVQIEDVLGASTQKKVTAIVGWSDVNGAHQSRLTTILGRTL